MGTRVNQLSTDAVSDGADYAGDKAGEVWQGAKDLCGGR
jgi:hypothetical protein